MLLSIFGQHSLILTEIIRPTLTVAINFALDSGSDGVIIRQNKGLLITYEL